MKVGMLSFAHMHAHSYASALAALPDVTLAGVYDADAARGRIAAERYGTTFFSDADALLDTGLDGVIVCSENVYHRELVERAAPRTPYILCEKPLATTLADARAMIETCAKHGAKLQTAFPVRFAPPVQSLKKMLDDGALGKIISAVCTNHGRMPLGWFLDKDLAGGGAVIDHTVHVADLLRWFWATEVREVYAEIGHSLFHPDTDIDDAGLLSFTLANGVYGTLDTSWSRPENYPVWGDVKLELLGERGLVRVDAFRQHLSLTSLKNGTQYLGWGSNADLGLIEDFVETMRSDRAPSISGEDGLKALEVALAAYESAATGEVVELGSRGGGR